MEENVAVATANDKEKDVMSILMDSSLFYELSLDERQQLLRQVIQSYLSA
jgi:hypothetical protein